jgi:hypothetical protein
MITHSFKDLEQVFPGKRKVASFKPGESHTITKLDSEEDILQLIKFSYYANMSENRQRLVKEFKEAYGRPIFFKDSHVGTIMTKIKDMMDETGAKSLREVTLDIQRYLGYPCYFFRRVQGKMIPIDPDRISKAYRAVRAKESFVRVEDYLYF